MQPWKVCEWKIGILCIKGKNSIFRAKPAFGIRVKSMHGTAFT